MARELISKDSEAVSKAFDEFNDIFEIIEDNKEALANIIPEAEEKKTLVKSLSDVFANIIAKNTGKIKTLYETGCERWDDFIGFGSGITMIAAAGGIGKTTLTTFLMKKLLKIHYEKISIMWITIDHEDAASTIRKFISNDLRIDDKHIQGKRGKLSPDTLQMMQALQGEFLKYDISFEDEQMFIDEIRAKFISFCTKREGRFPMLVIDNIMKLRDYEGVRNKTEAEDKIANVISNINNQTRKFDSQVIFLHHFTKEQAAIANDAEAYRPRLDHVRGSDNLKNIAEQIILLNRPGNYPDMILKYPEYKEVIKHLFIVQVQKNTFGELIDLYYWCNMKYNDFKEIECINNFVESTK